MSLLLLLTIVQSWHPGSPMPTPGYGFACARVGNLVYAIAGLEGNMDSLTPRFATEAYDVPADSWITGLAPMPRPRWFSGCAVLDGRIYVIGGTDGRNERGRVDRYDPRTNLWDSAPPLPWSAQALTACVYNGALYAAGGFSTVGGHPTYLRKVAKYEPGADTWTMADSMETPRANLGLAVAFDRLYAVGGRFFSDLPTAEHYVSGRWQMEPRQMREPRSGLAAVGCGEYLAAIGGMGQHGALNSVELLNAVTGEWLLLEPLEVPRSFLGAAQVGTKVAAIGGRDMRGATGAVEIADSLFFVQGIEETQTGSGLPRLPLPSIMTAGSKLELKDPGPVTVRDDCGRLVYRGRGSVELCLAPGVYFLRLEETSPVTHKLTIVR